MIHFLALSRKAFGILLAVACSLASPLALAYETDQYSALFHPLEDSAALLDRAVNDTIREQLGFWKGPRDDKKLIQLIAGLFHGRQLENWANDHSEIARHRSMSDSIFRTAKFPASPVVRWKGLAATLNLHGTYLGTDKLSHFFGVGYLYFLNSQLDPTARTEVIFQRAARIGRLTEQGPWGELTTNVFSNADLVANIEGFRFYKSVLEDGIVRGKKALIRWEGNRPVLQRSFTFRDHVSDYWSEALLPSRFERQLEPHVVRVLQTYCLREEYRRNPQKFEPRNELALNERYKGIGIQRSAFRFRMREICPAVLSSSPAAQKRLVRELKNLENEMASSNRRTDAEALRNFNPPVKTCAPAIRTAIREHDFIVGWQKAFEETVKKDRSILEEGSPEIQTLRVANQVTEVRLTRNSSDQACLNSTVPLATAGIDAREKVEVIVHQCFTTQSFTGAVVAHAPQYRAEKDKALTFSVESFYRFDDREGYVYRTTPYLCRWY